jgi:hypothetical protein
MNCKKEAKEERKIVSPAQHNSIMTGETSGTQADCSATTIHYKICAIRLSSLAQ